MACLPSSVRFAMLRNCLKGLSSISLALFRRLLSVLLNFIHSSLSRRLPWFIPRLFQPAPGGGRPKTDQSGIPPGIAASNLPGILATAPNNASSPVGGSLAPITGPSFPMPATTPDLQSRLHRQVPLVNPRRNVPFVASTVQRYGKDIQIEPSRGVETIPPIMRQYPERQLPISTGWEAYVHPEGALYFYHPKKRVFTDTDAVAFLADLDACIDNLLAIAQGRYGIDLTSDIELTVQLGVDLDAGERVCSYYFTDRAERTLFWLHELDTGDLFDGVRGVREPSHIRYAIQFQYCIVIHGSKYIHYYRVHCELYPNNRKLESHNGLGLLMELREIIVHASADVITSDKSLSPFGGEELSKILDLISHLQETTSMNCRPYSMCVIARFMQYFARAKFFNFCGQPLARLEADQSIYLMKHEHAVKSVMSWVVELMCFGAPQAHMTELQRVWVDKSTSSPRWKDFNDKLSKEWISITIYSTVMLTVDLSFLTVPSVNAQTSQSASIILAYLSTFCVVGSLIVSILLAGQNRKYGNVSANSAVIFLTKMTNSIFGDKALATLHSLPYVLLMWGMIYFLAAFSFLVFRSHSTVLLGIAGCGLLIVFLLTLWPIWAARDVFNWLREQLTFWRTY